jgi:hypothetical protein
VALVAAGVLIIDDLITAAQGGQSVIRDFFMEFLGVDIAPILQKAYEDLKNFIADVKDLGTAFPVSGEAISTSIDLLKRGELQLFLGGTEDEYRQIAATSPDSSERDLAITQLKLSRIKQYGALNTYLNRDEIARLEGKEAGLTAGIEQRDARMGKGYEDLMRNYEASIAPFDRNSLLLLGQPGANSSREVNQDININIYSNDPRTTGDYVVGALKDAEGQAWASLPEVSR